MISVKEIIEVIDTKNDQMIEWNGLTIKIKKTVDINTLNVLVNYIVNLCFNASGEYHPELKDFALKSAILLFYTDIDFSNLRDEETEALYYIVYQSNLCDMIANNINRYQFQALIQAVEEKIGYMINTDIINLKETIGKLSDLEDIFHNLLSNIDFDNLNDLSELVSKGNILDHQVLAENK